MPSPVLDSPKQYQNILKSGTLYRLTMQNNWKAFTFVLSRTYLMAFPPGKLDGDPLLSYNVDVCLTSNWTTWTTVILAFKSFPPRRPPPPC